VIALRRVPRQTTFSVHHPLHAASPEFHVYNFGRQILSICLLDAKLSLLRVHLGNLERTPSFLATLSALSLNHPRVCKLPVPTLGFIPQADPFTDGPPRGKANRMEASMSAKAEESRDATEQPQSSCQLTSVPPMTPRRTSTMPPSLPSPILSPNQKVITSTKYADSTKILISQKYRHQENTYQENPEECWGQ
jgi:hypothetical protein